MLKIHTHTRVYIERSRSKEIFFLSTLLKPSVHAVTYVFSSKKHICTAQHRSRNFLASFTELPEAEAYDMAKDLSSSD